MSKLKELREQAGEKLDEIKRQRDQFQERRSAGKTGNELWPDESRAAWDRVNKEYDAIRAQIDDEKRTDEVEKRIKEIEGDGRMNPGGTASPPDTFDGLGFRSRDEGGAAELEEQRALAFQAWAGRRSERNRSERHLAACRRFAIDPSEPQITINICDTRQYRHLQAEWRSCHPRHLESRALSGHLGASGAFTIGNTLVASLERNMLAFGGVAQVADTITTDSGEEMSWPTVDDTSNEGEMLGENTATATDEDPSFGAVKWHAYEFSSKLVKVPRRLLEDSAFDLGAELGSILGERIGRSLNRKQTTGTGANQPKGIVTAAALGKTAASATAIIADEIIELEHSVDPAYREDPSFGFMCHDNIVLQVRLLKDVEGRFLWRSGLQDNRPDTLLGRRLTINQHMDSALATTNKVLLCGQFSKYKSRRVRQIVILRLVERFADSNQEGFVAFLRADGNLLDAGTTPIKYLQMA